MVVILYKSNKMSDIFLNQFKNEIYVLGLAWAIFLGHFWLNYWIYKKYGYHKSPIVGILIEKGYMWMFGIVVGLTFVVAMFLSFMVFNILSNGAYIFSFTLIVGMLFSYITAVCGLNLWGKIFVRRNKIEISQDIGWKGFVKKLRQNIGKEIAKRKKLNCN